MKERFLALHLPSFRLERCGWTDTDSVALVGYEGNSLRVKGVTSATESLGITVGISVAMARAMFSDLVLEWLDPVGEEVDIKALMRALRSLSDKVTLLDEELYLLGVRGVRRLFGGEQELFEQAIALVQSLGHIGYGAIADDPIAAAALARARHRPPIVAPFEGAMALASLPIHSLQSSREAVAFLRSVGVESVSQLAALDRLEVAERLGAEGVTLHRLSQGESVTDISWGGEYFEPLMERCSLDVPTTTVQRLKGVMYDQLSALCARLTERDEAVVLLSIRLELTEGTPVVLRVRPSRPTYQRSLLSRLIEARLEGLRLSSGIESVVLAVEETTRGYSHQPAWMDRSSASEALPELLVRLIETLGSDAIYEGELVDTWRPESAWRCTAPVSGGLKFAETIANIDDPVDHHRKSEQEVIAPRPSVLFEEPTLVEVRAPTGVPLSMRERGGWRRVVRSNGPERIQGEWWDSQTSFDREYWVVEEAGGGTSWIFCAEGRWYRHGWFD